MVPNKSDRNTAKHTTARYVPRCSSRPATDLYAKFSAGLHDPRHVVAFQLLFWCPVRAGGCLQQEASTRSTSRPRP